MQQEVSTAEAPVVGMSEQIQICALRLLLCSHAPTCVL